MPSADAVRCSTSCKHAQADVPGGQIPPTRVDSNVDNVEDGIQPVQPSGPTVKAGSQREWDATAHVVHSDTAKGPVVKLLAQNSELQAVIRQSFHILIKSMLFEDAYPPYKSCTAFARVALLAAARKQGPSAAGIKERLKAANDGNFAAHLADLVSLILAPRLCNLDVFQPLARMNLLRTHIKEIVSQKVLASYGLTNLSEKARAAAIAELLADDRYIFVQVTLDAFHCRCSC